MAEKTVLPGMSSGIALPPDMGSASFEQQVVDFLTGRSDGAELMLAIYGDIAEEELPPRLADLLRRWRGS